MYDSLKTSILHYVDGRYPDWVSGIQIETLALQGKFGKGVYKGATADRRCRELAHPDWLMEKYPERKGFCGGCEDGIIAHRDVRGFVEYRGKPDTNFVPVELRNAVLAMS